MKKIPTKEDAKKFLEKALTEKLVVPEEARKLQTDTIIKLHNMGLLDKEEMDSYLYLTKATARAIAQKK